MDEVIAKAADQTRAHNAQCIITSRMVAPCDNCGRAASPVHMPLAEHGLYCADCCPACSPK